MSLKSDRERLMTNLRISLPGVVDSAILNEYFMTVKDFLQESNIWRDNSTIDVDPKQASLDYDFQVDEGEIVRVLWVADQGGTVQKQVAMMEPGILTLSRAPLNAGTWTINVALTTADPLSRESYPVFPDWIQKKYLKELIAGTLARMMIQPVKPYSNPTLAAYNEKVFWHGVAKAKVEAEHGNLYRAQRWLYPQNFARPRIR